MNSSRFLLSHFVLHSEECSFSSAPDYPYFVLTNYHAFSEKQGSGDDHPLWKWLLLPCDAAVQLQNWKAILTVNPSVNVGSPIKSLIIRSTDPPWTENVSGKRYQPSIFFVEKSYFYWSSWNVGLILDWFYLAILLYWVSANWKSVSNSLSIFKFSFSCTEKSSGSYLWQTLMNLCTVNEVR